MYMKIDYEGKDSTHNVDIKFTVEFTDHGWPGSTIDLVRDVNLILTSSDPNAIFDIKRY